MPRLAKGERYALSLLPDWPRIDDQYGQFFLLMGTRCIHIFQQGHTQTVCSARPRWDDIRWSRVNTFTTHHRLCRRCHRWADQHDALR